MLAAIGFTIVSGLLLVWMLALTRHAWRTLPPGAQVPVHGGHRAASDAGTSG